LIGFLQLRRTFGNSLLQFRVETKVHFRHLTLDRFAMAQAFLSGKQKKGFFVPMANLFFSCLLRRVCVRRWICSG
jgi:hypothetical protein